MTVPAFEICKKNCCFSSIPLLQSVQFRVFWKDFWKCHQKGDDRRADIVADHSTSWDGSISKPISPRAETRKQRRWTEHFSPFSSRWISLVVELSEKLSFIGLDDFVSIKSLGLIELRKTLSNQLPYHSPVKPRDLYSSGRYPKKARDHFYNRHFSYKKAQNIQIAINAIEIFPKINRLTIKMSTAWQ